MNFLNPQMLYGLFALAIPIAVHLFNFRRHKLVYFSDTTLLQSLKQETARTNRLKHLLVLLMRLLAITALVLAFARPYFPDETRAQQAENEIVLLYLDNSVSMQMAGMEGAIIDDARKSAIEIIDFYGPDKRFVLLTNSFSPSQERPMNRDEAKQELSFVSADAPPVQADEILERAKSMAVKFNQNKSDFFLLSDFQKSAFQTLSADVDSSFRLYLLPFGAANRANVYIDSCWLESPVVQVDMPVTLNVRLKNEADETLKGLALRLESENKTLAVANTDIDAWSDRLLQLSFVPESSGNFKAQLNIADYPIVFDDIYYINLKVASRINILELFEENPNESLALLFGGDTLFSLDQYPVLQFDMQSLPQYNLVVAPYSLALSDGLKAALLDYTKTGGALLLQAPLQKSPASEILNGELQMTINQDFDTVSTRINTLMTAHPFFADVFSKVPDNADLPKVNKHYAIQPGASAAVLVQLLNGSPFLTSQEIGQGSVFVMAINLDEQWSGLTASNLFAPLIVRMAFWGDSRNSLAYEIGRDRLISLKFEQQSTDLILTIKDFNSEFAFIPGMENRGQNLLLDMADQLPQPGFYGIYNADSLVSVTAWNASRKESVMQFFTEDEISALFTEKGFGLVKTLNSGQSVASGKLSADLQQSDSWWWFILAALLFLIAESVILRLWKSRAKKQKI